MTPPLISVIMPVYNVEKYIAQAIESVLNQSYTHFELLIINDGSPDHSAEVASQFVARDERVKLLHKPNGGLSDARNFGLDHATGRYVFFIDSDDWVDSEFLEVALDKITRHQSKLVVFGYHLDSLDENETVLLSQPVFAPSQIFEKQAGNLQIDSNLLGILGYAWNKLYDLDYIRTRNYRFTKGVSLVEDILFNAPFYAGIDKIVISDRCFYHYNNRLVPTLIKKFHVNSFELYILKTNALEDFLISWQATQTDVMRVLAWSWTDGIRYCIDNMIRFTRLDSAAQRAYILQIANHPGTQRLVPHYDTQSFSGKIYKYLIVKRQAWLLLLFLKFKKQFYVS